MSPWGSRLTLRTAWRSMRDEALELLLPARCQLCDAPAVAEADRMLCRDCLSDWPTFTHGCACCGRPGPGTCQACILEPPAYARARALMLYEGRAVAAVTALKGRDGRGLGRWLGAWMLRELPHLFPDQDWQVVVPMPMPWRRRLSRGYNQAELLAEPLCRGLGLPLEGDIRKRATAVQKELGLLERRRNLETAFELSPKVADRLAGKRVLVVDDVLTTGATVGALAEVLVKANVLGVDVLTVARTP